MEHWNVPNISNGEHKIYPKECLNKILKVGNYTVTIVISQRMISNRKV